MQANNRLHVRSYINGVEFRMYKGWKAVAYILRPDQLDLINALERPWEEVLHLIDLLERWLEEPEFSRRLARQRWMESQGGNYNQLKED